jgi:hypothetical protein
MAQFRSVEVDEEMLIPVQAMRLKDDRIGDVEQERGLANASLTNQGHVLAIAQQAEALTNVVSTPAEVLSLTDGAAMEERIAITPSHVTNSQEWQLQNEPAPIIHLTPQNFKGTRRR